MAFLPGGYTVTSLCYHWGVNCPRCQVELEDGRCPRCNWSIQRSSSDQPSNADPGADAPAAKAQSPIEFTMDFTPVVSLSQAGGDWRAELRKKLEEHYRHKSGSEVPPPRKAKKKTPPRATVPDAEVEVVADKGKAASGPVTTKSPAKNEEEQKGEVVRQLFRYKLPEVRKETERRIVTFSREKDQPAARPLEKPLIRPTVKARTATRPSGPQQKKLSLERLTLPETSPPPKAPRAETPRHPQRISREVLLSRVLSLVVDSVIALVAGFLFSFVAAKVLGMSFPSPALVQLAVICAVGFFFLNSMFFLGTSGQTPGMVWTDLKLVDNNGKDVSFQSVIVRTALFLPVMLTLVGLLWAVFDPLCRCWHDRLSGTRIVPEYLFKK